MSNNVKIPVFKLITGNEGEFRVSSYATHEFEEGILKSENVSELRSDNYYLSRILFRLWKQILKTKFLLVPVTALIRIFLPKHSNYFVVLMGPKFPRCFPYFFGKGHKAAYLFDAWPSLYDYIVRFVNDFGVKHLFVSSRQSTSALAEILENVSVHWVSEGISPAEYRFLPVQQKDIDVLSFGRNYPLFHDKIAAPLLDRNLCYLFPKEGELLFSDRESFINGLARARISICFPTNITHSERAGGVETMTNRYLQSMASKCLILGKAPEEMIELFGYNPVIEVDMDDPAGQVFQILENFDQYEKLIEKNHRAVLTQHSWEKRWEKIENLLAEGK